MKFLLNNQARRPLLLDSFRSPDQILEAAVHANERQDPGFAEMAGDGEPIEVAPGVQICAAVEQLGQA